MKPSVVSESGVKRWCKTCMLIGCNLCGVFKCKFLAQTQATQQSSFTASSFPCSSCVITLFCVTEMEIKNKTSYLFRRGCNQRWPGTESRSGCQGKRTCWATWADADGCGVPHATRARYNTTQMLLFLYNCVCVSVCVGMYVYCEGMYACMHACMRVPVLHICTLSSISVPCVFRRHPNEQPSGFNGATRSRPRNNPRRKRTDAPKGSKTPLADR